jgi:hypothetical protein
LAKAGGGGQQERERNQPSAHLSSGDIAGLYQSNRDASIEVDIYQYLTKFTAPKCGNRMAATVRRSAT